MRCFISIELPPDIIKNIVEVQKKLKFLFTGKFTEQENIHLTLKFLGEIDEPTLEEVKKKLSSIPFKPFQVKLGRLGMFNDRILWIEILGSEELQKQIDAVLVPQFPKEVGFTGHITIARMKDINNKRQLKDRMDNNKLDAKFVVESFTLKESRLSPTGPQYSTIEQYT